MPVSGRESRLRHMRIYLSRYMNMCGTVGERRGQNFELRSRRVIADMGDLGECAWFLVVEVLRALGKGGGGAWVWVE